VSQSNCVQKYGLLCMRLAAECRRLADDVPESDLRARFLHMARMWTELAVQPRVLHCTENSS
jgi:hypothetical protein